MNLRQNQLDFKGQHFFIGLDVHKRNWTTGGRDKKTKIGWHVPFRCYRPNSGREPVNNSV